MRASTNSLSSCEAGCSPILNRATTKILTEGGEQSIETGGAEVRDQFSKKMYEMVANSIAQGAEGVDDKAMRALAKEFAAEGEEEAPYDSIKTSLKESVELEGRRALEKLATETALNSTAGGIGGGSSGVVSGALEWDSSKSAAENLQTVITHAGVGALMGDLDTLYRAMQ